MGFFVSFGSSQCYRGKAGCVSSSETSPKSVGPSSDGSNGAGGTGSGASTVREKAKAFVINFDDGPRRRASIPQSVLQRRDQAAAAAAAAGRGRHDDDAGCQSSAFSGDSLGNASGASCRTSGTLASSATAEVVAAAGSSLSDSANFLIQKMLQSNDDGTNLDGDDDDDHPAESGEPDDDGEGGDHRSEAGTYTVDDPQAREARRKIDQVFGVHHELAAAAANLRESTVAAATTASAPYGVALADYSNRTRTYNKHNSGSALSGGSGGSQFHGRSHNVPVSRTQPVVPPPRRNRTSSSSTYLASSVPSNTNHTIVDSMISSTISSGSSGGGLSSKTTATRSRITTPRGSQQQCSGTTNLGGRLRRPSSSSMSRPSGVRTTSSPQQQQQRESVMSRPGTAKSTASTTASASTLRRGTYGGSDFSLESSNSSGSHLVGNNGSGDTMKMNRAFALRRARLGLQDPVVSQKAHLLTGSNPNLFSRQDGGRFSMRLPSTKQRTRPGTDGYQAFPQLHQQHVMSTTFSGVGTGPSSPLHMTGRMSPRTCRRNESDPCSINVLGQESDEESILSPLATGRPPAYPSSQRLELRCDRADVDLLSQSTFEASTNNADMGRDSAADAMCRSASFNVSHPNIRDRERSRPRAGASSPLLQRKETFLKQLASPQHDPVEQRIPCSIPSRSSGCGGRTASPCRASYSPQLQRRSAFNSPLSPQVARKVLPSSQVAAANRQRPTPDSLSGSSFPGSGGGAADKDRSSPSLSALDTLVVQAIAQLSGKLRLSARALVARESQRYPEGSDAQLTLQELLSSSSATPSAVNSGDISKELSAILRNLRNIEQSLNVLSILEPSPLISAEGQVASRAEKNRPTELPNAESLGDTVPRGFFTVAI